MAAPKNMASEARKTHMPIRAAVSSCSAVSNCPSRPIPRGIGGSEAVGRVGIGLLRHDGHGLEVVRRGGRVGPFPLQSLGPPGVGSRGLSAEQAPAQVDQGENVAYAEDAGPQ